MQTLGNLNLTTAVTLVCNTVSLNRLKDEWMIEDIINQMPTIKTCVISLSRCECGIGDGNDCYVYVLTVLELGRRELVIGWCQKHMAWLMRKQVEAAVSRLPPSFQPLFSVFFLPSFPPSLLITFIPSFSSLSSIFFTHTRYKRDTSVTPQLQDMIQCPVVQCKYE